MPHGHVLVAVNLARISFYKQFRQVLAVGNRAVVWCGVVRHDALACLPVNMCLIDESATQLPGCLFWVAVSSAESSVRRDDN